MLFQIVFQEVQRLIDMDDDKTSLQGRKQDMGTLRLPTFIVMGGDFGLGCGPRTDHP